MYQILLCLLSSTAFHTGCGEKENRGKIKCTPDKMACTKVQEIMFASSQGMMSNGFRMPRFFYFVKKKC